MTKEQTAALKQQYLALQQKPSAELRKLAIEQRDSIRTYIQTTTAWWTDAFAKSFKEWLELVDFHIANGDQASDETEKRKFYARGYQQGRLAAEAFYAQGGAGPGLIEATLETIGKATETVVTKAGEALAGAGKLIEGTAQTASTTLIVLAGGVGVAAVVGLLVYAKSSGGGSRSKRRRRDDD